MNKLIFLLGLVISINCAAQEVLTFCDEMPTYGKNKEDLTTFIAENVQYPDDAFKNNIQGRVVLRFVINEDGTLSNIELLKKVYPSIDAEAIRVIKSMPKWNPGKHNQKLVKVAYVLPIAFKSDIPKIHITCEWIPPHESVAEQIPPAFPGGIDSMNLFIWNTLKYPSPAKENKIQGTVEVTFQVDQLGNITNIKANQLGFGLTEEALRIVHKMPKWTPGEINRKTAAAFITILIPFKLNTSRQ